MKRTLNSIRFITDAWDTMGIPYTMKHGTYTTILESELGKHKFVVNTYSNKVFIARNKILKDIKESQIAKDIMNSEHETANFGMNDNIKDISENNVLNIDISSAYVYAIYNCGIITKPTFDYLQTMKKKERLPALGMLASAYTKFYFEKGKVVKYEAFRQPTAQIFFKLIQEINDVMEECAWILGEDYIFHWVDGIFFKKTTSVKKINQVEKILQDMDFPYKYEGVEKFKMRKDGENYVISMIKNGENKRYDFSHRNEYQSIKKFLTQCVEGKVHKIHP